MTDEERATQVTELLEQAEAILEDMNSDADAIINNVKAVVSEAIYDLAHVEFDEEGDVVEQDDDFPDPDEEDEEDDDDDDDEEEDYEDEDYD